MQEHRWRYRSPITDGVGRAVAGLLAASVLLAAACAPAPPAEATALQPFSSDDAFDAFLQGLAPDPYLAATTCTGDTAWIAERQDLGASGEGVLVTGRVSEVDGDPLAGAQAQVGTAGTLSAESGTFEIRLEEGAVDTGSADLRVQLIGYQSVELPLDAEPGQRIDVTVRMCPLALALESMVIASAEIQPAASVTNVQHAGVDEGGIVKLRDRHLVVLRRGRLHTVDLGDDALVEVDATEAFAEGIDASGDWYDEILLSGSDVVVLGYSYDRAATEIGLFRLADDGTLSHRATHQLRSFDYYSSRNYASRLVDGRLVLYAPMPLYGGEDPRRGLPAIRRWTPDGSETFEPVVSSSRVYQGGYPLDPEQTPVLHTILSCGVEAPELDCRTTAVVGGWSRVSYVSPEAVWLWVDGSGNDGAAMLYRLPLDGAPPGAVQVRGSPVDQFSFLEDADDHLNVVVRSVGYGEGMWGPEWSGGDVALLRLPVAALGDGRDSVPSAAYRPLPEPAPGQAFHNRFVGEHLLYGSGSGWGPPDTTAVSLVHVVGIESGAVASLSVPHGVERIEPMGSDAVVVGSAGEDLHFTGIDLDALPSTAQHFVLEGASQGELRSHGFFYRADGEDAGVMGLPVAGPARPGWRHLVDGSASVVFIRNADDAFAPLGRLDAGEPNAEGDDCVASCIDWYGNARPLFIDSRIFALMGYELVEGAEEGDRIRERRRVDFTPR